MHERSAGYTLLQLMACLSIVALLATVALPAWRGAMAATHAAAAESALLRSLATAITNAGITGRDVVLCPAVDGDCASTWEWTSGWIVFADRDGDRHRGKTERLIERVDPLGGGVRLFTSSGRKRIVVQPNAGNAGSNVTFTLCSGRGRSATRLALSNRGQLSRTALGKAESKLCGD